MKKLQKMLFIVGLVFCINALNAEVLNFEKSFIKDNTLFSQGINRVNYEIELNQIRNFLILENYTGLGLDIDFEKKYACLIIRSKPLKIYTFRVIVKTDSCNILTKFYIDRG